SLSKKDGGLPPDTVVQTEEEILRDSERVIQRYHDGGEFSMRKVVLAPCSPFSVTEELMKESVQLARRYGVRLHTHVAETFDENDFCLEVYGRRPLKLMEDTGFIGEDTFYAHGIHFNDDELKVLAETGTHIAHCPSSNMRLGSGICRVAEMLPMEINVALAVDGSASNDSSDMLGELRNALLLQRVKYGAAALGTRDVFRMASENGAKLLGYRKIGKLEKGYAADMAIFDVHKLEYTGALSDPLAALIFSGYNHGTDYTIVNGRLAVEHGRLTGFPEEELVEKGNQIARDLLSRV
ncbi:MAG TPA: 8-oxoguanine deaminase, partial [Sediminispirochaeta sp.]|nr:8-oxoguanine deaminase [Sediminispirochaeta sp.]